MPKKSISRAPYDFVRCLPRMSWASDNLFNLYRRSFGPESRDTTFTRSNRTLYQQKWLAKRLSRGYHGDWIQEKRLKHHYLPSYLPHPLAPRSSTKRDQALATGRFASSRAPAKELKTPLTSLMWTDLERRLDVLVFRACFAPSVYAARFLIIHGRVKVNGVKESNPGKQLDPGALFSVDPTAIPMLHSPKAVEQAMYPRRGRRTPEALAAMQARRAAKTVAETPVDAEASESASASEADVEASSALEAAEESAESAENAAAKSRPPPSASQELAAYDKNDGKPNQSRLVHLHGDLAARKEAATKSPLTFVLPDYAAPHIFVPAYLEVSYATCSAVFVRLPSARPGVSEIPSPYDAAGEVMQFTLEWYAQMNKRLWKTPRRPGAYRTEFDRTALHGHGGALVAEHLASKADPNLTLADRADRLRKRQREVMAQARERAIAKLPPHLIAPPHKSLPRPPLSSPSRTSQITA